MVESEETIKIIEDLTLEAHRRNIEKKQSLKKKREEVSKLLLKTSGIRFKEKCTRCNLNCEVKHGESTHFWAKTEGLKPVYNLKTCPRN